MISDHSTPHDCGVTKMIGKVSCLDMFAFTFLVSGEVADNSRSGS